MQRSSMLFHLLGAASLVGLLNSCSGGGATDGSTTANAAPVITSTATTAGTQGTAYSYNVTATDANGNTLTYSLVPSPVALNLVEPVPFGMTIDSASGVIAWTPAAQTGDNLVTVQVSDGSLVASQSFTVTVVPASASTPFPPVFITPPTLPQAFEGVAYSATVIAPDANGDAVNYSLITAPTGLTLDQTSGVINWTPAAGQPVVNEVIVQAQDSGGLATLPKAFTINVSTAPAPNGVIFGFDDLIKGGFNVTQQGFWTNEGPNVFSTSTSGSAIIVRRDLEVEIHNGRPRFIQPEFIFLGVTLINRGATDTTFAVVGYNDSHGVTTFSYSVTVHVGATFIVQNSCLDNSKRPMNVPIERLEVNGVSLPLPIPNFGVSRLGVGTAGGAPTCP